jgi:hypothetical protein
MKRFVLFVLVAGLVLAVGSAWALTLQPSILTTQSWGVPVPEDPTIHYWAGDSSDYNPQPANIGHWLTRTGAWDLVTGNAPMSQRHASPATAYPYISGSGPGNMPGDVYFTSNNPNWATIRIEVAGLADYNYFGIYKKGSPPSNLNDLLNASSSDHVLLFQGSDVAGETKTFTVPAAWNGEFGWYLATKEDQQNTIKWAWFSEASLNKRKVGSSFVPFDTGLQHFAFFEVKKNQAYYIGVEDKAGLGDKDYQDFVVFASVIPDASTWMLFLSGMPALALLRRKRA